MGKPANNSGQMIETGSGAPAAPPASGDPLLYLDTDSGSVYSWDGTAWEPIGGAGGIDGVGVDSISAPASATSTPDESIALGSGAVASGSVRNIAIGHNAASSQNAGTYYSSIAVGSEAVANAYGAVAVGKGSAATGQLALGVGYNAAAAQYATAIGGGASAPVTRSTALGWSAFAASEKSLAVGSNAAAQGVGSVCIGNDAKSWGGGGAIDNCVAIGNQAYVQAPGGIAIGAGVSTSRPNEIRIGRLDFKTSPISVAGVVTADSGELATTLSNLISALAATNLIVDDTTT